MLIAAGQQILTLIGKHNKSGNTVLAEGNRADYPWLTDMPTFWMGNGAGISMTAGKQKDGSYNGKGYDKAIHELLRFPLRCFRIYHRLRFRKDESEILLLIKLNRYRLN